MRLTSRKRIYHASSLILCYNSSMIKYISHQTALEFWRKRHAVNTLATQRMQNAVLNLEIPDLNALYTDNPWGLTLPLHVLVSNDNARKVNQYLRCHISSVELPSYSFVKIDPELIVSSPELCFVQMADELDKIELIRLGIELCGSYYLTGEEITEKSFDNAPPLTSVTRLSTYVARATGLRGRKKSAAALRYIVDGSASPMETVMVMRLTLPYGLGGYSLPVPILNHPIYLPGRTKPLYIADECWPSEKLILEYNSKEFHASSPEQVARDEIRRNALTAMGYQVIVITNEHMRNTVLLDRTVIEVSRILGKRQVYPNGFAQRQARLRRQLMPWL